jgi:hypothetical protein
MDIVSIFSTCLYFILSKTPEGFKTIDLYFFEIGVIID